MGPFKCPDCRIWWAGFEHRCQIDLTKSTTDGTWRPDSTSITVRCTCPPNRGDNYVGSCPIHDTNVTYTGSVA